MGIFRLKKICTIVQWVASTLWLNGWYHTSASNLGRGSHLSRRVALCSAVCGEQPPELVKLPWRDFHLWFKQSWWFAALHDSCLAELHLDFWKALLCPFVLSLPHCLVQNLAGPSSLANASESPHSLCAFDACSCWLPKSFLLWRAQMHRVRFVAHLVRAYHQHCKH